METALLERIDQVLSRLSQLESAVEVLVQQKTVKEWYTTDEVASLLGKAPFTVREWCRLGRVHAAKRDCGRGHSSEWVMSHEELLRLRNHGLLPITKY